MVSIVDRSGVEHFVNPEYVTAVESRVLKGFGPNDKKISYSEVWVTGHAGYGTFSISSDENARDLAVRFANE